MIDIDSINKNVKSSNRRLSNMGNVRSQLDSGAKNIKRKRNKGSSLSKMTASVESAHHIYHEEMSVDKEHLRQLIKKHRHRLTRLNYEHGIKKGSLKNLQISHNQLVR